jgi:fructose-bisphosphate aldolase class I
MACFKSQYADELVATANAMSVPGKGILAADESTGTIGKRFAGISVENIEENRRAYRELLFTTDGFEKHCSGVIMFEETLGQSCRDGTTFVDLLNAKAIIPGIKVDKGVVPLPGNTRGETTTQGLDGLGERCAGYYARGARFAKWRAVLTIGDTLPSIQCLDDNAECLARYAAICQQNGLVPIVEPEILTDGAHGIEKCAEVTERVLNAVFAALMKHKVMLEGMILKPNMVTGGSNGPKATRGEVADATVTALRRTCPAAVPGILFLSGGQSEDDATAHLDLMNKGGSDVKKNPWTLSFSYGRALQTSCLKAWVGAEANVPAAQAALLRVSEANSKASLGQC